MEIKESFAVPAHTGYIKSVTSCPRFLVSGGTDETVRIFDLKKRRDVGSLSQHDGAVSALAFAGTSHLLTGGDDGRIGLFRIKDWECLHVFKHKKVVKSLAIHPSGKVAMSVGLKKSIKVWNLMTGKVAHTGMLTVEPLRIRFSETGRYYAVLGEYEVVVWETVGNVKVIEWRSKTRLASLEFLRDERVYVAGEGSLVQVIYISDGGERVLAMETGQKPRIKDLSILCSNGSPSIDILVTGSSSGSIKGWSLSDNRELFSHNSGLRITCLTASLQ